MKIDLQKTRFIKNALSLYFIRGINMLFPIILIPLIIKRLGLDYFGMFSIVISVINILILIIDYGFTYTATRDVAKVKHSPKLLSEYFSSVVITQGVIFIITLGITALICVLPKFAPYKIYFLICTLTLIGYLLNPGWLFQGLETSYISAIINLFFRIFTILILYFFLNSARGLSFFFIIYSLGFLGWGLISFIVAIKKYKIKLVFTEIHSMMSTIKGTSNIFIANLISSLYLAGIPMILNLFSISLTNIASYSIAEKIIRAICSIVSPLSIALIPYFVNKSNGNNVAELVNVFLKVAIKISVPFLFISLFILFGFSQIVSMIKFIKHDFNVTPQIATNIKIQSFIIFFSVFNNIVGISSFVTLSYLKAFRNIMIIVISSTMLVFVFLIQTSNLYVGSIAALFSEGFLTLTLVTYLLLRQYKAKQVKVVA